MFGQVGHHILAFVPDAALDLGLRPEDLLDRAPQPLAAIDHHQQTLVDAQPAGQEAAQERRAGRRVLRARLDEAQEHLLPAQGDAQRDHHRVFGEPLPIQDQGDDVLAIQPPLLQRGQLAGGGVDVRAGDGRPAQAEGFGNGFSGGPIVAAAQAVEDPSQHTLIGCPWFLQPGVALHVDLEARLPIPDPGDREWASF